MSRAGGSQELDLSHRYSPHSTARGETMIKLKLLGATATLFALTAAPALSQQAIQEPGLYAFYHPDGDSMSTRAPTDAMASTVVQAGGVHPRTREHGRWSV